MWYRLDKIIFQSHILYETKFESNIICTSVSHFCYKILYGKYNTLSLTLARVYVEYSMY